jgi:hypothetical protein
MRGAQSPPVISTATPSRTLRSVPEQQRRRRRCADPGRAANLELTFLGSLSQNSFGVPDSSEPNDNFGHALAAGDFDGNGSPTWQSARRTRTSPPATTSAR